MLCYCFQHFSNRPSLCAILLFDPNPSTDFPLPFLFDMLGLFLLLLLMYQYICICLSMSLFTDNGAFIIFGWPEIFKTLMQGPQLLMDLMHTQETGECSGDLRAERAGTRDLKLLLTQPKRVQHSSSSRYLFFAAPFLWFKI